MPAKTITARKIMDKARLFIFSARKFESQKNNIASKNDPILTKNIYRTETVDLLLPMENTLSGKNSLCF
jgi:hypothetical protein